MPEAQFETRGAATAREGTQALRQWNPDVLLLDLGLPDQDGIDLTREVRTWSALPIIVLSVRGQESDKVAALDAGADDYLTKPFGLNELLARIRVALRRAPSIDAPFINGDLRIDFAARMVWTGEREVHLTPNEFKFLALLARHAGQVVTHKQILTEVWGEGYEKESHYLRLYMTQLRHKLEPDPAKPRMLQTDPGVGYRLRLIDD